MKKLATLLIAMAIMLGLSQCKKNNIVKHNDGNISSVTSIQQGPDIERILNFNKAVQAHRQNPDLRTREIVDIGEAAYNIADLFNVTYTEPMAYYTTTESHQFNINVPLTAEGKVLVDDVVAAYEQAVAEAREAYHGSALANKGYRRLMVAYEIQRDGEVCLNFDGSYGERGTTPPNPQPHVDGPFSVGDDWHYKDGMGSCDGLRPGGADKVLQDTIMREVRSLWPADPNGCRGFFTSYETHEFSPLLGYTGIFYSIDPDDTCIEWQYMNDYLAGERRNVFQAVPQDYGINLNGNPMQQYRYFVTNVVIEGQGDKNSGPIYHWTEVEYARYNYIENGTIERGEL